MNEHIQKKIEKRLECLNGLLEDRLLIERDVSGNTSLKGSMQRNDDIQSKWYDDSCHYSQTPVRHREQTQLQIGA